MAKRNDSSGVAGCLNREDISDHSGSPVDETELSKNTFPKSFKSSKDLMTFSDSDGEETKVNSSDTRSHQKARKTSESDGDSHHKLLRSLSKSGDQHEDSKGPLGSKTEERNREVHEFVSSDNRALDKQPRGAVGCPDVDKRSKVKGPDPDKLWEEEEEDGQFSDVYHREKSPMDVGAHHSWTKEVLPTRSPVDPLDNGARYLGVDIDHLKKTYPARLMRPLRPSPEHVVLVEVSTVRPGSIPTPYKGRPADPWNQDFVKMPHSQHNLYESNFSSTGTKWRWKVIFKALGKKMPSPHDIEKAIKSYNKKYERQWKFDALDSFFTSLKDAERQYYLKVVIPKMAELALKLPDLCPKPIPMLKKGHQRAITMSQQQVACLLCNAFFCTFPRRNAMQGKSEYATYPSINFNRLFEENSSKREKLRAIFCYFDQVVNDMRTGLVTFERRKLPFEPKKWSKSQAKFTKFHVSSEGTIEENGEGMLQVDFASPIVGGGVLGSGLVQEEIRFLINTELIVSRLFTEKLDDDECLLITGAEQYSRYAGYSRNFEWKEAMKDSTQRDAWQRRCIEIVAIDAIRFRDIREQFTGASIERDLNKAYCGFQVNLTFSQQNAAVATGNWGCGAFNGHPKMKGLLQLMAAAEAGRDVAYFTFGDRHTMRELHEMHLFLEDRFTVGQLYTCLKKCCKAKEWKMMSSFYDELKSKLELSKM